MKIRAITAGLELGIPFDSQRITMAGRFLTGLRAAYEDAGVTVQTLRLATTPLDSYAQSYKERDLITFARALEECCRDNSIDFCSVGPIDVSGDWKDRENRLLALLPAMIAETETVFAAATLAAGVRLAQVSGAHAVARVIQAIARATPGGFGNLRFAALVHCPPHIPFFPAAFHAGAPAFSVALEAADVVGAVCAPELDMGEVGAELVRALEEQVAPVQRIAQQWAARGFVFRGIDLSPAPGPGRSSSIVYALERLNLGRFGEPGTLTAAGVITSALKKTRLQTCGYCGLMLPVLEDTGLAERNEQGLVRLSSLLAYSAICGTGLDTIPLPGAVSESQLASLLLDVATLGERLGKPLSARLLPIPGKLAGQRTEFDFAFFVNTTVMAVS